MDQNQMDLMTKYVVVVWFTLLAIPTHVLPYWDMSFVVVVGTWYSHFD